MIDLKHVNMIRELESLGIKFTPAGPNAHAAICPLHADTDPSFHVYHDSEKDKFHCFGCHKHGDIIDFFMAFYGCDWREAAGKVGVKPTRQNKNRIKHLKRQNELVSEYRSWKIEMISGLLHLCELAHEAMVDNYIPETLHEATITDQIVRWNHWIQIILSGDDQEILKIYKAQKDKFKPITDFAKQDFERRAHGN